MRVDEEADYVCWSCGETIVIPVDASQGSAQEFVEDCPVCCHPNRIRLHDVPGQGVRCESQPE